ncbi:LacI family transcriptional regulator [Heyndrickxia shackletonii]|uniref:LacI family transcriptional regulator n=1 Tax=Heyndrickxia shackletonii TaxID=157838 RepID=A0A0Q3WWM5_9BACI|nr:LacI family DNA-binding transcriptional regulator [Heyndrickxia shackletonii]KQL53019.1 LacI family transcriptional regulator [Heyndrickxia shackletonii]NEY98571.1 LacI family transcriptional regulator [Heyndrickxia shackletonii]
MKITIRDVANAANVSPATVSRVINTPELVGEETKVKVQETIDKLGFSPNAIARGLSVQKTNTIGLIVPGISDFFFNELYVGIEEVARKNNMKVLLFDSQHSEYRVQEGLTFLKQHQVDGIIFTSRPITSDYDAILSRLDVPVVLALTQSYGTYPLKSFRVDDYKAAYDAVSYLISRGHQRIGMISGPTTDIIAGKTRLTGYKAALQQSSIPISDEAIEYGEFRFEDGYRAMARLLEKQSTNKLTAVFAASDEMAIGAMRCLHDKGIRVPDDISVMGFDDLRICQMSTPTLTTVAQPLKQIGEFAVSHLLKCMEDESTSIDNSIHYVSHHIVERESVRIIVPD